MIILTFNKKQSIEKRNIHKGKYENCKLNSESVLVNSHQNLKIIRYKINYCMKNK
jgi:hypothetical protein